MNKKETNTTTFSITRGQSISRDLLTHVLKFSTSVTGAGRILGYFTNTLTGDEKVANFDTGN